MKNFRELVTELQKAAYKAGDPLRWHNEAYQTLGEDVPWADMRPNPYLFDWVKAPPDVVKGKRALVIGCGFGDNVNFLAKHGADVTGFDIAKSAVNLARKRFPELNFEEADLFHPPKAWIQSFDFVFEAYTLQVLPEDLQTEAMARIADFVRPKGKLLVVTRAHEDSKQIKSFHQPLRKEKLSAFIDAGLQEVSFVDLVDGEEPPVRRFIVEYQKTVDSTRKLNEVYASEDSRIEPGLRKLQFRSLQKEDW